MVSVDVAKTDVLDLQERDAGLSHLDLSTFATVNHKQAPTYIQYLGAWISFCSGQGRSRAQYIKSEIHYELLVLELALESCECVDVTKSSLLYA